jgi:hypothetical protein
MNVQKFCGSQSENFNTIKTLMMKMKTILGITYNCKQALPVMNFQKTAFCFSLNEEHFHISLHIHP